MTEKAFRKVGCSWSGGKDSCYALLLAKSMGYIPTVLLNMMNENGKISRSHGLPKEILEQQAAQMNLPIVTIPSSWKDYESNFVNSLKKIKSDTSIEGMVFGDIDLQPHRDWEEKVCDAAELEAILPLWNRERRALAMEMIEAGIETMIVSCNIQMGEKFLGRIFDHTLIDELEHMGIDVCGENGEFHTVVLNCPLFKNRIEIPGYRTITHEQYCFIHW